MGRPLTVLVHLEDDALGTAVLSSLRAGGFDAERAASDTALRERIERGGVAAWLVDVRSATGRSTLAHCADAHPETPAIAVAPSPRAGEIVAAFRAGARDFLTMPFELDALERCLARVRAGSRPTGAALQAPRFLTRDAATRRALAELDRAAASDATILLCGESGTGKELLARRVHAGSPRHAGPLVFVACAGLAASLAESELFGHEAHAFTGAESARTGQIATADAGTLVLDEVADLSLELQPKLLRAIQEREILPVGARAPLPVDLRVVATTQRDLPTEVADGRFREDLYYRLNVVAIRIPPLRERPDDIALLAEHFLARFADDAGADAPELSPEALVELRGHALRGNVRELENWMRRLALLHPGGRIDARRLQDRSAGAELPSMNLRELERSAVIRSLEAAGGNRTLASQALGISVRTLRNKIRAYELT